MIDDNPIDHLIVSRICEHESLFADVIHLNDTSALLDLFTTNGNNIPLLPDIILLNISAADNGAWDFLKQFNLFYHQLNKTIDVYLMSSSANTAEQDLGLSYKFVKHMFIKPMSRFSLRQLYQRYQNTDLESRFSA